MVAHICLVRSCTPSSLLYIFMSIFAIALPLLKHIEAPMVHVVVFGHMAQDIESCA